MHVKIPWDIHGEGTQQTLRKSQKINVTVVDLCTS